jgi:ATP-dependent DNA helicase RecG
MDFFSILMQPVSRIKGVGEQNALKLNTYFAKQRKKVGYRATVRDLLFHLPYDYVDRREITPLIRAREGVQTICVRTLKHLPAPKHPRSRPAPYRIQCEDDTGSILLVFFRGDTRYLEQQLPIGQEVIISGQLQLYDGMWQMTHPDVITTPEKAAEVCRLQAIYPASEGISSRMIAKWSAEACAMLPQSEEWLRESTVQHFGWQSYSESIKALHRPETLDGLPQARMRLAYDEALAHQLALRLLRMEEQKQHGICLSLISIEIEQFINRLPFELTQGQQQVLKEIAKDLHSGDRMLRLLQGDVGAGKTVIAAITMLAAVTAGYQAVLMAPTEILARQHLHSIDKILGIQPTPIIFLAGSLSLKQRDYAKEQLRTTPAAMIIGTHALFQEGVEFANVALIVIDEQHRFGVSQRLALSEKGICTKGTAPHMLLMTATPIPRSLAMACYGDLDVSLLKQKPANRKPIETLAMGISKLDALCGGIARAIEQGEKMYWICPLVEEAMVDNPYSPIASLQAAQSRAASLELMFPSLVGLIHGRMSMEERERVMMAFYQGKIKILVATTVVEVGVDVPDATVIVIENAERFGLAQLHQLRGRVGRSEKPSRCILLYHEGCSSTAKQRLKTMRETNDGFVIAEADLKLRGSGEMLGTRQTGLPDYVFLNIEKDADILSAARQEALLALEEDKQLEQQRGSRLRRLLTLHELDDAVKYLRSG